MKLRARTFEPARRQLGAASLIVVMVLFFIVAMVAAYTNRNLIFEQRTSANQMRSTMALEAAEGGLQWALGLLNSGRIDSVCRPSTNLANTSFRQRYLDINGENGRVTPLTKLGGGDLTPSCVFNKAADNWDCSCPLNGDPSVAVPAAPGLAPAFRVRFVAHTTPGRQRLVRIEVNGCTAYSDDCLKFSGGSAADNEGRASASAYITLKGAIAHPPIAAVTARGGFDLGGAATRIINANLNDSGDLIYAGGAVATAGLYLDTIAGSLVGPKVVSNDAGLQFADFPAAPASEREDAMFVATFGMGRTTYREQPGTVELTCSPCSGSELQTAAALNPGRILWAPGDVSFDISGDIGSSG